MFQKLQKPLIIFSAIVQLAIITSVAILYLGYQKQQGEIAALKEIKIESLQPVQTPTIKSVIQEQKTFIGLVKETSSNFLIVEASIIDVASVPVEARDINSVSAPLKTTQKTFTVGVNSETVFSGKKITLSDIKVGDLVTIETRENIYATDKLTALTIKAEKGPEIKTISVGAENQTGATTSPR